MTSQANSLDLQNRISSSFGRTLMSQANSQDLRAESASPFGRTPMSRANSQDLCAENASHHLKSAKSASATETFSSGREFSEQANSSELFYPTQKLEFPEFENGSTFQKYVSQRPIFLNSGKYMREQFARPFSSNEGNMDAGLRGQSRLAYDTNLINSLFEMVKILSAQVKQLQEQLDSHMKATSDARQKRDEEAHQLTEKFDALLSSFKKNKELVADMQLKIVKSCETMINGLRDVEKSFLESNTKILKEVRNISEDRENLKRKLMERTESMQGAFEGVTKKQMKNMSDELSAFFSEKCNETERKNIEQIRDLKSFIKLSLQPLTENMYRKSELQEPSTRVNSEKETVFDFCSPNENSVDQIPAQTRRLRQRKAKSKSVDVSPPKGLPSTYLLDPFQNPKDSVLQVENRFITTASVSKNKLRSTVAATSYARNATNRKISVNSPSPLSRSKMKRVQESNESVPSVENPFINRAPSSKDKPKALTSGTCKATNRKSFSNFSSPPKCHSVKRKQGHKDNPFVPINQGVNHTRAPKHFKSTIAAPSYPSPCGRSRVMWNSTKKIATNLANHSEDNDVSSQCSTDSSSSISIHDLPLIRKAVGTRTTFPEIKPIQFVTANKSFQNIKSMSFDDIWA